MTATTQAVVKFGDGNNKLGKAKTFSIPAIDTCPGRSKKCEAICYATRGHYHGGVVQRSLKNAFEASKSPNFAMEAIALLQKQPAGTIFRIHPSGDLYDAVYINKWIAIIKGSPHITFWIYTRSWRLPALRPLIEQMAKLPNVQVWFSCDQETGKPTNVPKDVLLAYMMVDDTDIPKFKTDLIFRDGKLRKSIVRHVNGTIVCPTENGKTNTTCEKCKICWRRKPAPRLDGHKETLKSDGRIALSLLVG